jgi:hypothetical protein
MRDFGYEYRAIGHAQGARHLLRQSRRLLNAINSAGLLSLPDPRRWSPHPALEGAGIALAHSRLFRLWIGLMLADYDPSIRTAETTQVGETTYAVL